MWDKLSWFGLGDWGWGQKRTVQPDQRDVTITVTNGDRRETIIRSPSGNKLNASVVAGRHALDDDDSSDDGSTSINFGLKANPSPNRRDSSYSVREPLDHVTWSNVTSPGFTSRLVQASGGGGHSPLKDLNDSMSHSPFRKSPYRHLTLGQLPYTGGSNQKPKLVSPTISSPTFKTAASSAYNRGRRKPTRQGQVFVRINPIDPTSESANISINKSSSSPITGAAGNSPFSPRDANVSRSGNESFRNDGLGGISQHELNMHNMRYNRLWPTHPGGPVPGPGRPSSPTSPSNIMEALTSGRKRSREHEIFYPPNTTPPSMPPPTKISIGIGDTPVRTQISKRVKFLGSEAHDRPMMVPYSNVGAGSNEPLSSESILEQMNQTEKRFLPDAASTPYSPSNKKGASNRGVINQSDSSTRKRRSQSGFGMIEEQPIEKSVKLCNCSDCCADAAGNTPPDESSDKRSSYRSNEKGTNTGGNKKETCEIGIATDPDKSTYFKNAFRKAISTKPQVELKRDDEILKHTPITYTKAMYDRDKKKRLERYYRITGTSPPEEEDVSTSTNESKTISSTIQLPTSAQSSSATISAGFNFGGAPGVSTLPDNNTSTSTGGFSFGKQSTPIAHTITTTATTTRTSPSLTASIYQTNPTTTNILGTGSTIPSAATPVLSSIGSSKSTEVAGSVFSGGSNISSLPKPASNPVVTSPGGFSFSGTIPSFGQTPETKITSSTSSITNVPSISTSSAATLVNKPEGLSFPIMSTPSKEETAKATPPTYSFGKPAEDKVDSPAKPAPTFNFGSGAAPPSFGVPATSTQPTTTAGGFSFGAASEPTKKTEASSTFSFGSNTTTTTVSSSINSNTTTASITSTSATAPSFGGLSSTNFGQTTPSLSSTFGSNTFTAVSSTTSAAATTSATGPSFSFGGSNLASPATTTANSNPAPPFGFSSANVFGSSVATGATSPQTTTASSSFGGSQQAPPAASATLTFPSVPNPLANKSPPSSAFGQFGGASSSSTNSPFGGGLTGTQSPPPSLFGESGSSATTTASGTATSAFGQPTQNTFGTTFGSSTGLGTGGFSFGKPNPVSTTASTFPSPSAAPTTGNSGGIFGSSSTVPQTSAPLFGQTNPGGFGSASTSPASGGFSFSSVPNPLKSPSTVSGTSALGGGGGFGSLSSPTATTGGPAPVFGAGMGASSPPMFGGGLQSNTANSGTFSFGSGSTTNALSSPQVTGGGAFGASPQQQNPVSSGFAFGQQQQQQQPANPVSGGGPGVFQFGQAPPAAAGGSTPFQFGQAAQAPGGFNFGAAAAAAPGGIAGGPPMFNMGTNSTAPRRRDIRRRYR